MNSVQIPNFEAQQRLMENGPDARRMRKAVFRRTIDYNGAVIAYLKDRVWQRSSRAAPALQPDYLYNYKLNPPSEYLDNPMNCVTGKPVRTSTNKNKCPIYCVCWTPEGRRLITGAFSGEFTLWNGLTFNFETILQAHESQIRCMKWSNNDEWLLTADHSGYVKYWQANMNNVEMYQAHKEPIRGVSFSPFDTKFVTCSDDSTVRIWDFLRCTEERVLRGHGSDVRSVAWHPYMSLIMSGSKDAQQPIKLWEPKTGESIATLYVHKNTCTDVAWNRNGNWFLTASRDHLIKLFDLRYMKSEIQTFRGHKRDVMRVAWHPYHESLFASGSADGAILFWCAGTDTELGAIDDAHESMIWSLAWHPLGHILVSGANDFATKFWTRNRPGDILKDILGPGNASSVLPALAVDGVNGGIASRITGGDEVGGSLARALADAAGRLPIFESTELTLPIPQLPEILTEPASLGAFEEEGFEAPRIVEIPGLNDGLISDGADNDSDADDASTTLTSANSEAERNRSRQARSIPREFIANWGASRSSGSIALSMVGQATGKLSSGVTDSSSASIEELVNNVGEKCGSSTAASDSANQDETRRPSSVSAPMFSSDMRATHTSSNAGPTFSGKAGKSGDEDYRHKQGRKYDTAAREEDMLAFAKGLNLPPVNDQRGNHASSPSVQPPPLRFNKPMGGPRPPMPPSQPPIQRPRMDRPYDAPQRFLGPRPPIPHRDYPGSPPEGWQGHSRYADALPPPMQRGGPWGQHPMGDPPRSGFRPPHLRPGPDQWAGPPHFREDGGPFPPAPKRAAIGRNMNPNREPWNDHLPPLSHRGNWQ